MTREEQIRMAVMQSDVHNLHRYAFMLGAEWADSHPRWISVEDELPPENDIVLTANDRGGISMGYYCDDDWHNIMFTDREQAIPITHWLQVPEPPK